MSTLTVTITCLVPGCFTSASWEDEPPHVTDAGGWTVTRRPPPNGWHLPKPFPHQPAYSGPLLDKGRGFCPKCSPGAVAAGHAVR